MHAAVTVFPGSNCDRDLKVAFEQAGFKVSMVWHKDTALPKGVDVVGIPGGFSFGDYLRCGAIAANAPICRAVVEHGNRGGYVLGICNGFQVLTEMRLLPGVLMRNAGLKFVCKTVGLKVETTDSAFTAGYAKGAEISVPVAHHDGNYTIDAEGLAQLQAEDRVAFTYSQNPNGAVADIAGVLSANRRVLGMMPHPERVFRSACMSWTPGGWGEDSPWMRLFRNARLEVFREALGRAEEVLVLDETRRHARRVAAFLNRFVALFPEGERVAVRPTREAEGRVEVHWVEGGAGLEERRRFEADLLARRLLALKAEGYAFGEMAVLVRSRASLPLLERAFRARGVPYVLRRGQSFFNRLEVRDLYHALRLALLEGPPGPEERRSLLAFLRSPFVGLNLGEVEEALLREDPALLPPRPEAREERLYWHAARYRLLREEEDLKALLSLTDARERVLPGLVPLDLLPRKRPELARAYPLEEVLRSGWKEAVALRLAEIPPLRVEVLGSFRVRNPLGGVELKGKAREVLAILLLGLPREEVAFALWPDLSEEAALNNLYVWLNRLRKALEPWGLPTYLGEEGLKHLACDLHALEEALRREDAEAAFALYREPLFPGLDHPLLDRKREEVFHRVRALFLKKGEPRYLERLLELDPLDEEALLPLVERCLARGQRARALAHLERYRRRLWEELGERPSPEVEALLRELGG